MLTSFLQCGQEKRGRLRTPAHRGQHMVMRCIYPVPLFRLVKQKPAFTWGYRKKSVMSLVLS